LNFTSETIEQINNNSLYHVLGIHIEEAADGNARSVLAPTPEVCWPYPAQPHGGILFALMDTTMAWAVNTRLEQGYSCTTINCNVQYLAPAQKGPFQCRAGLTHRTGRMAFVQAHILDAQETILISGQAVFRLIKLKKLET
jgi:uncharacterized protein (TIGR00369 family)